MDKQPPVEVATMDSPRTRRYPSDGPVLSPGELSDIVKKHMIPEETHVDAVYLSSRSNMFSPSAEDVSAGRRPYITESAAPPNVTASANMNTNNNTNTNTTRYDDAVKPIGEPPFQLPEPPIGEAPPECPVPPIGELPSPPPTPARPYRRCLLRRACCVLTLQQGAYAVGVLQLVTGLLALLMELMYMAGVLAAGAYALDDDFTGTISGSGVRWGATDIAFASLSGFLLLQELINLFFAGLLIHGARMERAGYIGGWLLYTGIMVAITLGAWAGRITLEFLYKPTHGLVLLLRCFLHLLPAVYALLVVRSYYYKLVDRQNWADERLRAEKAPLVKPHAPPPYSPTDPMHGTSSAPQRMPLLETDLDRVDATGAITPAPASAALAPASATLAPAVPDTDDEGGFGAHWTQQRAAHIDEVGPLSKNSASIGGESITSAVSDSTLPRVVAVINRDGSIKRLSDSSSWPGFENLARRETDGAEGDETVEIRPISRRVPGAGPMVLPPLPPGHRESLQHVVTMENVSPPQLFSPPSIV